MNNFYPEKLFSASIDSQETVILTMDSVQNAENFQNLTFIHRAEVQLLVDYLKNISWLCNSVKTFFYFHNDFFNCIDF